MSEYPNSGAIFPNNRQRPGTKDPDRNGVVDITCPKCNRESSYWISGWLKEGKKGKFMSLAFKVKDADPGAYQPPNTTRPAPKPATDSAPPEDDSDGVPF